MDPTPQRPTKPLSFVERELANLSVLLALRGWSILDKRYTDTEVTIVCSRQRETEPLTLADVHNER